MPARHLRGRAMSDDADWRDVTPMTPGFEFEVQQHRETGEARHRRVNRWRLSDPEGNEYIEPLGPWHTGWPGKGLQW